MNKRRRFKAKARRRQRAGMLPKFNRGLVLRIRAGRPTNLYAIGYQIIRMENK